MGLGPIVRGGRRILGEAAKKRKGVTADIARKEKKLTAISAYYLLFITVTLLMKFL